MPIVKIKISDGTELERTLARDYIQSQIQTICSVSLPDDSIEIRTSDFYYDDAVDYILQLSDQCHSNLTVLVDDKMEM